MFNCQVCPVWNWKIFFPFIVQADLAIKVKLLYSSLTSSHHWGKKIGQNTVIRSNQKWNSLDFVKPKNARCITFTTFSHETQMNASFSLCSEVNYSKTLWTSKNTGGIILTSNNRSQKEVTKKVSFLSHSTHNTFGKNIFSQNQDELWHQIQRKRKNLPCQCLLVGRELLSYWICNNLWKCTKHIPENF